MLASLAGALLLSTQSTASLDRSGEPLLRASFDACGRLTNSRLLLTRFSRSFDGIYLEDSTIDVWLGSRNRIRLQTLNNRGNGSLTVSDGVVTLVDPLTDDEPIRLTRFEKNLETLNTREPLLFFLAGESAFDRFVDQAQPVKLMPDASSVEVVSKPFGKVRITVAENKLPEKFELFQSARRRDAGVESEFPLTVETVRVLQWTPQPDGLFSVIPPPGRKVQDDRFKAKPVSSDRPGL